MQEFFKRTRFIARGFKFTIINSMNMRPQRERLTLCPEHDYIQWSYNVKTTYKEPHKRRQKSLYMAENRDLLNIYEVTDRSTGVNVGVVRYHFGAWEILDTNNRYFSLIPAENIISEIFFLKRIPHVIKDDQGGIVGEVKKISSFALPLFYKYIIDFSSDKDEKLDRRLAIAAMILFIYAHERVGTIEKVKYYIATKLGFKLKDKPFILRKKTVFGDKGKRSVMPI